jgi:hypothetical protein
MSSKIKLLVPEGRVRTAPISSAPRLNGLKGKVIGFMHNGKPNADILLSRLASLMQKKYGWGETRDAVEAASNRARRFHRGGGQRMGGGRQCHRRLRVVHFVEYPRCD